MLDTDFSDEEDDMYEDDFMEDDDEFEEDETGKKSTTFLMTLIKRFRFS
nr:hypothetical protein [Staphylococcus epidermidis]